MSRDKLLYFGSFAAIYIIWGSTYLFNKILVTELPPLIIATIRFGIAAILIFGISFIRKDNLRITRKQFWNTTILGFLFLTYGNGAAVWALKYIDSGLAAVIISTQPLFLIIMLWFLDRKPFLPMQIVGVFFGMIGMYLLLGQDVLTMNEGYWIGIALIISCLLSWGLGSIFVGRADLPKNTFISSGYQMLMGSIMLCLGSLIFGESWAGIAEMHLKLWGSMWFLIIFGSIVAFTAFNYLLKRESPEKVATNTYVNPVVAMLLGWWILDEVITPLSIVSVILLLTGVYFIQSSKTTFRKNKKGIV